MSQWLFNLYMDGGMKELKIEVVKQGAIDIECVCLLLKYDLVLCDEAEESLRGLVEGFLKINIFFKIIQFLGFTYSQMYFSTNLEFKYL